MNQSTNSRKVAQRENYDEICRELGFEPACKFVEITPYGAITFTVGKSSEIRALHAAVLRHGYKPSTKLTAALRAL